RGSPHGDQCRGTTYRDLAGPVGGPPWLLFVGRDLVPDLLERPPDQARDVHLRDADLLRDLRLRQPLEEAQVEDRPLAVVEDTEAGLEQGAVLGHLVLVLDLAESLERVELLPVFL